MSNPAAHMSRYPLTNFVKFGDLKDHSRFWLHGNKYIKIPEIEIHGHDWNFLINCIEEDGPGNKFCPSSHGAVFFENEEDSCVEKK